MKEAGGVNNYIGSVWPGFTTFPDWSAANTSSWWTTELLAFYKDVAFSGIWLDMNEVSSFVTGSQPNANLSQHSVPFALPGEPGAEVTAYPEGYNSTISGTSGNMVSCSLEATQCEQLALRLTLLTNSRL